ncbi:nucleotidyltransferase domain-containing protein [Treponema sp.]|uniref:nucleotidyltransferase domain-containing protein n=1 Tax=Treponema sp. TaxID=166 RepID=UPI00298E086C|nr:nucleotidyltransferase domain-containing protein [Treponema sp.]MCQ2241939.1 nucleotidyltransferase domain-containing protein [Treponema sp.]
MTHEQIVKEIKKKLSEIEKRENIKIIYACESGSRAWGFASPDSDYDVRFVYVRPLEDYLKLEGMKDTLECELNEVYDISGWDLKKLLSLLERSNPSIFEWANSPIVYKERREWKRVLRIIPEYFSVLKSLYHYNSTTKNNLGRYFDGKDEVTYKKYLYNLRQCLACEWVMDRKTPPTIEFPVLVDSYLPAELKESVAKLFEMKVSMAEKQTGSRIQIIDEYIQTMVDKVDRYLESMEITRNPGLNKLDSLFLKLVR